jgi:hypothetical protein
MVELQVLVEVMLQEVLQVQVQQVQMEARVVLVLLRMQVVSRV